MVLIFVLITFALFITIDLLIKSRKTTSKEVVAIKAPLVSVKNYQERFLHPGHSWLILSPPNLATVGVNDFTNQLLCDVDKIDLPVESTFINQGDPLVTLHHGKRSLTIVSPLSGILKEVNHPLELHPELISNSLHNDGWISKIVPINPTREVKNLLQDAVASVWEETLRARLIQLLTPKLGLVLQDGGNIVKNFSENLTDAEWEKIVTEFFPIDIKTKNKS